MIAMKHRLSAFALSAATALTLPTFTHAHEAEVVTSIKPLHSLTAMVLKGIAEPQVLVKGKKSPHGAALSPSQAQSLQAADMIVWVGPHLETFLQKPLKSLGKNAKIVTLIDEKPLNILPAREHHHFHGDEDEQAQDEHGHDEHDHDKSAQDEHGHDEHDHDKSAQDEHGHDEHDHDKSAHDEHGHDEHDHDKSAHDEHGHDEHDHDKSAHDEHGHDEHDHDKLAHDDHDHDKHAQDEVAHEGHDHDDHGAVDSHIWLSVHNAEAIVQVIAHEAKEKWPEHAAKIESNEKAALHELHELEEELATTLEPYKGLRALVYHDSLQYFEKDYGIKAVDALTINPEVKPGARSIKATAELVKTNQVSCIFSEPQFNHKLPKLMAGEVGVPLVQIDPLGADIAASREFYPQFMRALARSVVDCAKK
ncbi:zinc ABC transporter substrate-binding protein [Polycladidibacter hongkongensis]|uniref:zinc ABC transporter substrate-binding protein n=1 Tax=Polycladidibacter hongkongensis TaxID=1647556 RepID=UPI0008340752|nr:zinc ABC transporter substrate-binding protein [Pseudovibrio hongkongensis]